MDLSSKHYSISYRYTLHLTDKTTIQISNNLFIDQAVINSHDALVPILIEGGADVNTPDEESLTPLHMAAR